MAGRSPWSRFVDSAVQGQRVPAAQTAPVDTPAGDRARKLKAASVKTGGLTVRGLGERVGAKLRGQEPATSPTDAPRRRTDVRLALPAFLVWSAAVAGVWLTPMALVGLCCGLVLLATCLLIRASRGRALAAGRRSFLMTTAVALMLAAVAAAHSAVASSQRNDGPLAEAVTAGNSVVAILEVTGSPRAMTLPGSAGPPERWSVAARTEEVTVSGRVIRTRAAVVVMGGKGWGNLVPGQAIRTAGKLKPPDAGQQEAAILSASLPPRAGAGPGSGAGVDDADAPGWQLVAKDLRVRYVSAASFLAADPAGLLPGMVTGDTSALDVGLNAAMKTVGMTHLTAVSGANCSLILGALLIAARSLRLPRLPAAGLALTGLAMFVVLVGPDASVLRAALMGSIAVASLAGGRMGRGFSFLCLAVMGLLLIDPGLGTSFGFLLSVLATLGIIVLGRRMIDWTPAVIPRWAAAAWAVPLSAQLLCGPVIVLLQPQFSTYSLLANLMAAPLVAPVTLLGTAAVPLVVAAPWLATVLIAVAGTFSAGVAGTARITAGLPGAALPWPEGPFGLLTMVLLSILTFAGVWLTVRPRQVFRGVLALHARTVSVLDLAERHLRTALARSGPDQRGPDRRRPGLVAASHRGRLRHCTRISGRNPPWPQPRPHEPGLRRPTRPPGGT
ncbi:ComEC/Rec2 family competence protein [Pseudarthrobacter psychrotolerans]|uniref:ComEC/Rec2 family competence protein n=1 Tax=Pseudarthrobacter psychrotolerans TaxID=2697569 RepID=A0A6P1NNV2_9MICC|nr:ComEC/Rec2 family competence protein [Pseudarthrobacter psychrotolerans]QHK19212.1 ComEC/Rec2 family competence protein [Pseudarthrobacter psychrotolerans]